MKKNKWEGKKYLGWSDFDNGFTGDYYIVLKKTRNAFQIEYTDKKGDKITYFVQDYVFLRWIRNEIIRENHETL